jgi:hypothetical protein
MSYTCFEPEGSSSRRRLCIQVCYSVFYMRRYKLSCTYNTASQGEAVPFQTWSGPEGSRKLRFPDYMTSAQEGHKVVSLNAPAAFTPRK